MKKLICTKLLIFFSINLLATPLTYCGKRKNIIFYGKRSKSFLKENKFERRRHKEKKIKKQKHHETFDKKTKKIKFRPTEGDATKFSKQLIQMIEEKDFPTIFDVLQNLPKNTLISTKKQLPKKLVNLFFLNLLLEKGSACWPWKTIYEDEEKIIEECCTINLMTAICEERTIYKNVTSMCKALSIFSTEEETGNNSDFNQTTNITCCHSQKTLEVALTNLLPLGITAVTLISVIINLALGVYLCSKKAKEKSNEKLEEIIVEGTTTNNIKNKPDSQSDTESNEIETSTKTSESETSTESEDESSDKSESETNTESEGVEG